MCVWGGGGGAWLETIALKNAGLITLFVGESVCGYGNASTGKWLKWQGEWILRSYMSEPKQFYKYILDCKSYMYRLYILIESLLA